ncbi:MAG: ankyrin repeat domain-containing protein [Fimbriimonadaceae bacterium]
MIKQLPTRPNIDVLKREAKTLLNSSPELTQLAQAQHKIAQNYGSTNWADLKQRVEEINFALLCPQNWLLRTESPKPIPPHPNPKDDWWIALANGDAKLVNEILIQDKSLANTPGGSLDRYPIHYVTCQNVQSVDLTGTLKLLIENGADPNARYEHPDYKGSSLSPLWGTIQVKQSPSAAQLLLENGADPNDNESLYHCAEIDEPELLELLFKFGANPDGTNGLARALDFNRLQQVKIILEAGADPNQTLGSENMLCHAIRRNRPLPFIQLLLKHGADPNQNSNEGYSAFKLACYKSPLPVIEFLQKELPDQFELESYDIGRRRFLKLSEKPKKLTSSQLAILPQAAFNGNVDEVKSLLANGWPVDAPDDGHATGSHGATALLAACFPGYAEIVKICIEAGANINAREPKYGSTPLGWALHGSVNSQIPGGNHLECARLLIEAGVNKPEHVHVATESLRDLLAEHNYLPIE